jgi:Icc-related predicted phosphoesterase
MKIICISDTHGKHRQIQLPEGDLLLHTGDFMHHSNVAALLDFNDWLADQPFKHKVIIAGNHDRILEERPNTANHITNAIYLNDSGCEIEGIKIWGSPVSPWFYDWAFNRERGADIKKHWDLIPNDTDILLTHTPPFDILDKTISNEKVGCVDLLEKIKLVQPKLSVFGHIHEARGMKTIGNTTFINASMVNVRYELTTLYAPFVVSIFEELKR